MKLPTATATVVTAFAIGACGATEPDNRLSIGESATVVDDLDKAKPKIEITPIRVKRGSPRDLERFVIQDYKLGIIPDGETRPAQDAAITPIYVTVRFKNVDHDFFQPIDPDVGLEVVSGTGDGLEVASSETEPDELFKPCPQRLGPRPFLKGESYETCLTFLIPRGKTLRGIAWKARDLPDGGILWEP